MAYNPTIYNSPQLQESNKFVEILNDSRFPPTSVIRWDYRDSGTALSSVDVFSKYGIITYLANASDINLVLSASEVDIGNVGLLDNSTIPGTTIYAQIVNDQPNGAGGALMGSIRVRTQPLPQLDALTAKDFATDTTLRSLSTVTFNTRINNTAAISGSVTVLNPVTALQVTNTVAISTTQTLPVSGSVTVLNPVTAVKVTGSVATTFDPTQVDAFNRLRVSSPLTLFDSSHRYRDNFLWSSLTANGGSIAFSLTEGLINMNVTSTAGSSALRETTKVFSYQPGKSLLILNTFTMGASSTNLVQRVGYFGDENGIYLQLEDDIISFVERSIVTGTRVNNVVPRSSWNGDKLDGTGPSGITLDITKAQIMWMDIEWLGVGTVRVGFVINGQFITCHSFHHANIINTTYITTASLPLRIEIFNKGATSGSRTLKQICSSVISEGGYELRGLQQSISIPISAARTFAADDIYYPIISIRLKSVPNFLDAIIILTAISIIGKGNGPFYNWRMVASGTTSGGTWSSAGDNSAVEYNITGTGFSGGRVLASGFINSANQGSPSVDILKEALFKFQLERNIFTSTPYELSLIAAVDDTTQAGMFASLDWEEISR